MNKYLCSLCNKKKSYNKNVNCYNCKNIICNNCYQQCVNCKDNMCINCIHGNDMCRDCYKDSKHNHR